jgi:hypothetical protein
VLVPQPDAATTIAKLASRLLNRPGTIEGS